MKTSDFYFDLPQELIAQDPLEDVPLPDCWYLTEKAERHSIAFSVISLNI